MPISIPGPEPDRDEGHALVSSPLADDLADASQYAPDLTDDTPATPGMADGLADDEREVLFHLNGVDYYVPKRIGPNVGLRYLRDINKRGQEAAIGGILRAVLGDEALDALAEYDDLTDEEMEQIMRAVHRKVLGPLENARGKAGNARRR